MTSTTAAQYKSFDLPGADYYAAAGIKVPRVVQLRHMTVSELRHFAKIGNLDTFMDKILDSCIGGEEFDHDQLLIGDRIYLFYMIRALTMGGDYSFEIECENCNASLKASVDLFKLPVKTFNVELGYPLKVHLPHADMDVEFSLMTRKMEKAMENQMAKVGKQLPGTEANEPVYRLTQLLTPLPGKTPLEMRDLVADMHYLDWKVLDKAMRDALPQLDLDAIMVCESCNHSNEFTFSLRPKEFFLLGD